MAPHERTRGAEEWPCAIVLKLPGEQFDRRRHLMLPELKAVTYHQLNVERADDGWKARIVFDV